MLFLIWLVLCLVGAAIILLPLALWRREVFNRYSGSRLVSCPENQQPAAVNIDLRHAADTGIDGTPQLRLFDCTRWPERADCAQSCLSQAVRTEPYAPAQVKVRRKQIYHLPIFLAAFAAWYLGAIWHAQYMFRGPWLAALGLTRAQINPLGWLLWPHLFTAAAWLLFAYGVAWLLAVCHRKGVLPGLLISVLLWGALAAATSYGMASLPRDLLLIEAGYTVLATLAVGAIVGGLYDKLVLPSH